MPSTCFIQNEPSACVVGEVGTKGDISILSRGMSLATVLPTTVALDATVERRSGMARVDSSTSRYPLPPLSATNGLKLASRLPLKTITRKLSPSKIAQIFSLESPKPKIGSSGEGGRRKERGAPFLGEDKRY